MKKQNLSKTQRFFSYPLVVAVAISPGVVVGVILLSFYSFFASAIGSLPIIWLLLFAYHHAVMSRANTKTSFVLLYVIFIVMQLIIVWGISRLN